MKNKSKLTGVGAKVKSKSEIDELAKIRKLLLNNTSNKNITKNKDSDNCSSSDSEELNNNVNTSLNEYLAENKKINNAAIELKKSFNDPEVRSLNTAVLSESDYLIDTYIDEVYKSRTLRPVIENNELQKLYCDKNYNDPCPLGWNLVDDYCVGKISYSGPKNSKFPIPKSEREKQMYEEQYLVRWPCKNMCFKDYNYPCPNSWSIMSNGTCKSQFKKLECDSGYYDADGKLIQQTTEYVYFNGKFANNEQKFVFAELCKVDWPCKEKCEHDYRFRCPIGWSVQIVEGMEKCEANEFYTGDCPSIQGILTNLYDKQTFEDRCQVMYPCSKNVIRDLNIICPEGYQLYLGNQTANDNEINNNNTKLAVCKNIDKDMQGFCNFTIPFNNINSIEKKKQLEFKCNIKWPEKSINSICIYDYNSICPIGWTLIDKNKCQASYNYNGRCNKIVRVINSNEFKNKFVQHCDVRYTCLNYSSKSLWEAEIIATTNLLNDTHQFSRFQYNGPIKMNGTVLF